MTTTAKNEPAEALATALENLLERGETDDFGNFVIRATQEERDDEENGIVEVSEAIEAVHKYRKGL